MTETERLKLVCPHCDKVIATAPVDRQPKGDLVCSNCGAVVQTPTILDELGDKVQEVAERLSDRLTKGR
jgi:transcription elongation factor Elf1